MESNRENKNGCETTETAIPPVGSGDQEAGFHQNQEGSSDTIKWSEEFQCFTVNGILAPIPLSAVPLETVVEDELQPESSGPSSRKRQHGSPSTVLDTKEQQESASTQAETSKKKRKSIEGNEEFFFRLFKFPNAGEQYLLEMHEVKTGGINRCHLFVYESNGRWKVGVYDLEPGNHVVLPMLQDPSPLIFHKKYELSLQDRLVGWTVEKRKRGNGKEDKFYYHRARQFRSFVEVATYALYSSKLKDLQIMSNNKTSQEVLEAEAVEAMMIISSSNNPGNPKIGTLKENKNSSADLAAGKETNLSPLPDLITEKKTPQESSEKADHDSSSSSMKTADEAEAWQVNENWSIGVEAGSKTGSPILEKSGEKPSHDQVNRFKFDESNWAEGKASPPKVEKNEIILADPPNREKTEPDEIETDQFMDYISDIFEDDAPQSMSAIFGDPKL